MNLKIYTGILLAFAATATIGAAPAPGVLQIEVGNVRAQTGSVHADICTEAQFLKDCSRSADAPAKYGTTTLTLTGLRPGRYAVQVYYDQNGNHKVDRALFGVPKEGVGFSNDAKIRFAPPKWEEAAFDYDGHSRTIRLKLRYFSGPDGPNPAK
ncbi:DUF2141 domain-containing protein [Sphingomonas paeninsulae]|uniref:DUF2141 domain-containing protein n=1 Tax=Sphingomonas paeninsulae TaxID=2319844 RepID=A0A494THC6_SPHPE|nr:DUF2141 domain-containing protein [Sphingomonas paeninsulae]AYJ86844.1 DUF2141 domain-containing protein [Sphingomonas paeninsulae]